MGSCCSSSSTTKDSLRSNPYAATSSGDEDQKKQTTNNNSSTSDDGNTVNENAGGLSSSSSNFHQQQVINKQYRRLKASRDPNSNSPTSKQPSNTVVSDLFQEEGQPFVRKSVEDKIADEGALFCIVTDDNNNVIDQYNRGGSSSSNNRTNSITASNSVNPPTNNHNNNNNNNNNNPSHHDERRQSDGAFSFNNSLNENPNSDSIMNIPAHLLPSDHAQNNSNNSDSSKSKSSSERRSSGNNSNNHTNNTNNHIGSSSLSLMGGNNQKGPAPHAGGVGGGSSIVMGNSNNNLHIVSYGPGFIPSPFSSPSSINQQYFGMPPVRSNPNAIARNNSNSNTGSGSAVVNNNNFNGNERRAMMKPPDLQYSETLGPPPNKNNSTLKGEEGSASNNFAPFPQQQRRFGEIQQGSEHLFAPLSLDESNNNNNKNACGTKNSLVKKDSFAEYFHHRGGPSRKPANNSATVINLDDSINEQQGIDVDKKFISEDNFQDDHHDNDDDDDDDFDRNHQEHMNGSSRNQQSSNVRGTGKDIQFGALDDSAIRLDIEEAELDGQQAVVDVQSLTLDQYRIYKEHLQKRQLEKEQRRREVLENKKRLNETQIKPAFDFSASASASTCGDNSQAFMPNLRVFSAPPGISPYQNLSQSQRQSYGNSYNNHYNHTNNGNNIEETSDFNVSPAAAMIGGASNMSKRSSLSPPSSRGSTPNNATARRDSNSLNAGPLFSRNTTRNNSVVDGQQTRRDSNSNSNGNDIINLGGTRIMKDGAK